MKSTQLNRWLPVVFAALWLASTHVQAQTDTFIAGSGLWSKDSSWSLNHPPNGEDCVISDNSTATVDTTAVCGSLAIGTQKGTKAVVTAPSNGGALNINGSTLVNYGTLSEAVGVNFGGTVTISGGGTINIAGGGIGSSTTTLVNVDNAIHGSGPGGNGIYVSSFVNQALGLVDANNVPDSQLLLEATGGLTNAGTLQASGGGTLNLIGGLSPPLNNTGGTIQALAGSFVHFDGYNLSGGTLTTNGTGLLQSISSSSFSNFTNNGTFQIISGIITLSGTVINNGTFSAANGGYWVNGVTVLKGSGTLSGQSGNLFRSANPGSTLTLQQPISGGGSLGDSGVTITNQSTITANNPSATLFLSGSPTTNMGTLEASNAATFEIQNTVNNAGGTITAQDGSSVVLDSAGTISGGTLTTVGAGSFTGQNGTLDGSTSPVTNQGQINVPVGDNLNTKGTIINNGSIMVAAPLGNLALAGSTTLAGSGQVVMSPGSGVLGSSGFTLTNQSTISGAGNIGSGQIGIINKGNIVATNPSSNTPLMINPGIAGFSTTGGTLAANAGCALTIGASGPFKNLAKNTLMGGTYLIAGDLQIPGANIVTNSAKITLIGTGGEIVNSSSNTNALANLATNSGSGLLSLQSGQTLSIAGNLANSGTVTVGVNSGLGVGGSYTQNNGTTTVDGVLAAPAGFTVQKGKVFGAGTISASVSSSGSVTAGDSASKPTKLSVGSYAQSSTGTLNIAIGGTTAGSTYGQLASSNGVSLGGTLNLTRIHGFLPKIGETFTIITGTVVTGQFATVNGLAINASEHFEVNYGATAVTVQVVSGA